MKNLENLKELANRSFDWYMGDTSIGELILNRIEEFEKTQQMLKDKGFFNIKFTTYWGSLGFIYTEGEYDLESYENFTEV